MKNPRRPLYVYDYKISSWPVKGGNGIFYFLIDRVKGVSVPGEYKTLYSACRAAKRMSISYHFEKHLLGDR